MILEKDLLFFLKINRKIAKWCIYYGHTPEGQIALFSQQSKSSMIILASIINLVMFWFSYIHTV